MLTRNARAFRLRRWTSQRTERRTLQSVVKRRIASACDGCTRTCLNDVNQPVTTTAIYSGAQAQAQLPVSARRKGAADRRAAGQST